MENTKLVGLIKEKNERLERETLRSAENLIDEIAKQQAYIRKANERITELRTELKALEVTQMDATELLENSMAITIKGIRVEDISIARDSENGGYKIGSASYSLLSSVDKVLAKQSIGSYGAMTLEPSPATVRLLADFTESYRKDVVTTLGLEE